ncbi:hypothetical protein LY78DRAFT_74387 [Colletotrichum sublineola]|nr:hypothetical protein LY78DRAFT_74387 [Colletotrichum sublineola]
MSNNVLCRDLRVRKISQVWGPQGVEQWHGMARFSLRDHFCSTFPQALGLFFFFFFFFFVPENPGCILDAIFGWFTRSLPTSTSHWAISPTDLGQSESDCVFPQFRQLVHAAQGAIVHLKPGGRSSQRSSWIRQYGTTRVSTFTESNTGIDHIEPSALSPRTGRCGSGTELAESLSGATLPLISRMANPTARLCVTRRTELQMAKG